MTTMSPASAITPAARKTVHAVVPDCIVDDARPSGGNNYDRRVLDELAVAGWQVRHHFVPGSWPSPDVVAVAELARSLAAIPDAAVVLIDGLVAASAPEAVVPESSRLGFVVLSHMSFGDLPRGHDGTDMQAGEAAVLGSARAVVTTSAWTRSRLLGRYRLRPETVHIAEPGTDPAPLATGGADGARLLCVAAVAPHKGHDVLTAALSMLAAVPWRCVCVGTLDRVPAFVSSLREHAAGAGIDDRLTFVGPRTGAELDRTYAEADLLVLASRGESYGMVVTEALARGLPVVASGVGGLPDAMGRAPDGHRPGLLVAPGDPLALAAALRSWLTDAALREQLRSSARDRRRQLTGWGSTAALVADVLCEITAVMA